MSMDGALVVLLPELDPVVSPYRMRHDRFARLGVGAHISVHVPWLPVYAVNEDTLATVRRLAASVEPFEVTFTRLRWFDTAVLWLAPDPEQPFRELSERSARLWPDFPLYSGQFDDVVPHATIGEDTSGDGSVLREVERELAQRLPLRARVSWLSWLSENEDGGWVRRATFELGGSR